MPRSQERWSKDGHDAITLNRLLGQGIDEHMKIKKYDISPCDCIVFDEILLYNPRQLYLIKSFMEENKDKRFHCTGDIDQRKPLTSNCNNIENQNDYQLFCLNQMFPDQITLRINKRLQANEDKERLSRIKKDIFDLNKRPIDTFKKHGITVTNKNILNFIDFIFN